MRRDPDNPEIWFCPHCNVAFCTKRAHYHKYHSKGQCIAAQQQQQPPQAAFSDDPEPDDDEEMDGYNGLAAAVLQQQRQQLADVEQRLIYLGLPPDEHAALVSLLSQHAQDITDYLQQEEQEQQQQQQQQQADDGPYSSADAEEAAEIIRRAAVLSQRRFEPLYRGSSVSALEADVLLFGWRHESSIKDRAIEALLQLLKRLLPEGNLLPESLYMLRKVLKIKRPCDYQYHACPNDKHYWKPLPQSQWSADASEPCPCGHQRFKQLEVAGGRSKLQPSGRVRCGRCQSMTSNTPALQPNTSSAIAAAADMLLPLLLTCCCCCCC